MIGTPSKFEETFHDAGKTNMAACMRAYRDIGYDGVCREDHWPTMAGEKGQQDDRATGRILAIGYIKRLEDAVYGE